MFALVLAAVLAAFVITLIEMTEVAALVVALGAGQPSLRQGAAGAVVGCAVVAGAALGAGAVLVAVPRAGLLWAAAIVLAGFGVVLFHSTLEAYRLRTAAPAASPPARPPIAQFVGGFTVGAVEATEVVVVLLALTAAGYGSSALLGAVAGGLLLAGAAVAVGTQVRRIKEPWLKWGGTSMLFAFAVFWSGEAAGVAWPGGDLLLVPLFLASAAVVRLAVAAGLRRPSHAPTA